MSNMSAHGCDIQASELAQGGRQRIEWALREMPVLHRLQQRFTRQRPLHGLRISAYLHVTSETANLARTLKAGGADIALCASNPLSTQDDVAAALVSEFSIPVCAIKGEDTETYYRHVDKALDHHPQITLDDGADLVSRLHPKRPDSLPTLIGGSEETTTGVARLHATASDGALRYPIVAVNDASAMAGAGAVSPCAPAASVPMSSLPKFSRYVRWKLRWRGIASCRCARRLQCPMWWSPPAARSV